MVQHKNSVGQSMRLLQLRCQVGSTAELETETPNVKHKYPYQKHYWIWSWIYITSRDTQRGMFNHSFSAHRMSLNIQWVGPFTDPGSEKLAFDVLHTWVTVHCIEIKFYVIIFSMGENFIRIIMVLYEMEFFASYTIFMWHVTIGPMLLIGTHILDGVSRLISNFSVFSILRSILSFLYFSAIYPFV